MRRWFLIVLLALLPLQLVQASLVVYCKHEKAGSSQHVGHHQHEHQSADTSSEPFGKSDSLGTTGGGDLDCEYCHLSCAQPLQVSAPELRGAVVNPLVGSEPAESFRSRDPDVLDRPNWSSDAGPAGDGTLADG